MSEPCGWFDRHQDGELNPEEEADFLRHMAACETCRTKSLLLDNLARTIRNRQLPEPRLSPEQISDAAFRRNNAWDALPLYLPRPATAWAAFAFLLLACSFFWILPGIQKPGIDAEYEMLMTDSDLGNSDRDFSITPTDDELIRWLEQGGEIQ